MIDVQCWCGVPFSLPRAFYDAQKSGNVTGHSIHCPVGHTVSWGETRVAQLEKQLAEARSKQWAAESAKSAAERKTKRVLRRANAGVCQHCHRTFTNVARHMQTKHPEVK